jgi:mycobactin lysine-N-oxygenase
VTAKDFVQGARFPGAADLLVVGAGAKAAAVAAKVDAINRLGFGPLSVTIVEAVEAAASWKGLNGMTSGDEPLAVTPIKDVGFPYESAKAFGDLGPAIDRAVMEHSWQQYLVSRGGWARWVNAETPAVRHRDYGGYLAWVLSRATAGVRIVSGRVREVGLADGGDRWAVEVEGREGTERHEGGALLLTGPGVHRHLSHDGAAAPRMFHCDSKRGDFLTRVPADHAAEIAIVGGGESALSCLAFLRRHRPAARLTVYTPTLPMSRGESFLENRVFADPDCVGWSALELSQRRLFVRQCDRGVFDPGGLMNIAYDDNCRFLTGRVVHVASVGEGEGVSVDYASPEGPSVDRYEFLVNCSGFDLLEQLRGLFSEVTRGEIERQSGPLWDRPADAELPMGRALELIGLRPRLHIPGLAALAQGPGFANLGCLGLTANRVLAPLVVGDETVPSAMVVTGGE